MLRVHCAQELNNAVPKTPFYFLKPVASMQLKNGCVEPPPLCNDLHFEVEMGVVIGTGGRDILAADAMKHVSGMRALVLVLSDGTLVD